MRRALPALLCAALLCASALPAPASAAYGLKDLDSAFVEKDGSQAIEAGKHPYAWVTDFGLETRFDEEIGIDVPDGSTKDLTVVAPPGLAGNPTATPRCTTLEFLAKGCPLSTQVGVTDVITDALYLNTPVYNLVPPPGVAAKLGFIVSIVPVTVEASVNPDPPYNILGKLHNISQAVPLYSAKTTIWGTPGDPAHNPLRQGCVGECAAGLAKKPFLTLPRACTGPLPTVFEARPWENPTELHREEVLTHDSADNPQGLAGCEKLGFAPRIAARPTSRAAEAPSGLDFDLEVTDEGLSNPTGTADSDIKKTVVTFPEGITLNPSQAEGLAVCSEADLKEESAFSAPGQGCPEASKVGTVAVQTPLLEGTVLRGALHVAEPFQNRFGSLIAVYMVIKDPGLGIVVKLAGKVEPDPLTGQITTTFGLPGNELPQFPLSHVNVHLREGARSPLVTPGTCGPYTTVAEFTPWADPDSPETVSAPFQITEGVDGAPCPSGGARPFEPGFSAGTLNNRAGSFSPFNMRLTRRDGDQDMTRFSATLPPGMVAKLAGTSFCPEASIEAAKSKTGKAEQASPSCPESSRIGRALGGAGVGSQLTWVPGEIYLAGPHNGAPLSVVAIVPAVAGPFDVGNVVVRQALRINPRTGVVTADGASSDPLPHILAGIPLRVRDIRVYVDKPDFTLNPTSCEPSQTLAQIFGGGQNVFSPLDDSPLSREARFQAADCASLGFKPRLSLKLKGGTKRGAHPALEGTFRPRPGDANLEQMVLRLPSSAFLDQAHIRTICTRVQFAANGGNGAGCPPGAIYGQATAWTPILDQPLTGPVYLRSSDNNLPDFVAALHGLVDVEAVARIDSVRGGIRASFEGVPDAPLSEVVVSMQGGKKGLIVNSKDLCLGKSRANARMRGQNGRRASSRPVVGARCGKGRGGKRAGKRR
jgi:hypothetical protein